MGVGNSKLQKPRGPRGWGIYNFENPGDPGGGGLRLSWGFPNPSYEDENEYDNGNEIEDKAYGKIHVLWMQKR